MTTYIFNNKEINQLYNIFAFANNEKMIAAEINFENRKIKITSTNENNILRNYILTLEDDEKYYEILKIVQYSEAEKRLKLLQILPTVINYFKKHKIVCYSERQNKYFDGILYDINNHQELKEIIKEFEDQRHALVYHAQLAKYEFGLCLSILFVSKYPEEWEMDQEDLKADSKGIMYPYAYVYNIDIPDFSDMGKIGIVRKNGGISRIY